MEREKTAVDFLYEFVLLKLTNEQQMQFVGLFHQAKQVEKEQIRDAYNKNPQGYNHTAEKYYNETYGKDENKAENND